MELLHESGEIIAQRYRILGQLGQGGSGTTYLAEDLRHSQRVALKALSLQRMTDWKMIELFEREARVLAKLNHSAIPRYLEYFHIDTPQNRSFYIAQQLAEGQSLAMLVQNGWRANEVIVRRIATQILEILVYLHELTPHVIHRDIKPQNIIWHTDGQVFLVDFGAVQDTYYNTFMRGSTVVGTYGYMAPEQFRGQAVPTTDLYSLGATLLFLLTHRSPADLPQDRLKIDFRSYVQISQDFADWLETMLEPDVEDRFRSAKEALAVLRGKRIVTTRAGSSVPWKALVGVGIGAVVAVSVLNFFKDPILNFFGLLPLVTETDATPTVFEVAERGDINAVRNYLEQGGNINVKDDQGLTLLHWAIIGGQKRMAELLVAQGIDINAQDLQGNTPLHQTENAQLSGRYRDWFTQQASWNSQQEIAKLLIAEGAKLSNPNNRGNTPLDLAVRAGLMKHQPGIEPGIVKLLHMKGAKMSTQQLDAKILGNACYEKRIALPLLDIAVCGNQKDIAEVLLAQGAEVNVREDRGRTPLYYVLHRCYPFNPPPCYGSSSRPPDPYMIELLRRHGGIE